MRCQIKFGNFCDQFLLIKGRIECQIVCLEPGPPFLGSFGWFYNTVRVGERHHACWAHRKNSWSSLIFALWLFICRLQSCLTVTHRGNWRQGCCASSLTCISSRVSSSVFPSGRVSFILFWLTRTSSRYHREHHYTASFFPQSAFLNILGLASLCWVHCMLEIISEKNLAVPRRLFIPALQ